MDAAAMLLKQLGLGLKNRVLSAAIGVSIMNNNDCERSVASHSEPPIGCLKRGAQDAVGMRQQNPAATTHH
jgi:hypothetical protein